MPILTQSFFRRKTLSVARDLIGKFLVTQSASFMITETEAYIGAHDLACHAARGRTARTDPLFGPAGHFYVYLIYGIHWMLNIVTEEEAYPAAVLLRGTREISGPGKLTKKLGIDSSLNTRPASKASGLWLEEKNFTAGKSEIMRTPRIGVDYAGPIWSKKPYRFLLMDTSMSYPCNRQSGNEHFRL